MSLNKRIKKSLLALGSVATISIAGFAGLKNGQVEADQIARIEARETYNIMAETLSTTYPPVEIKRFSTQFKTKGIEYRIIIESNEKRLTIEREMNPDSKLRFVDENADGTLDGAYILRRNNEKEGFKVYEATQPKKLETMFRRDLRVITPFLQKYREDIKKEISPKGQLV